MTYKSNIWKMYVFKFLMNLHFFGGVLIPFFTDWGHISFTKIMILQSIFVFSTFVMEVPTGAIADYFGRKTSLIFAAITVAGAVIIYSMIPNFYLFILGEIIWGASFALLSGADEALVYDSLKKIKAERQSKKIFGRIESFGIIAIMISAPIGSIIAATIGLRYAMMFMTVPLIFAAIFACSFKEPKTRKKIESKRYLKILVGGVKYFRKHKGLKILSFDSISIGVLSFMIIWTYQLLLKEMNVPIVYFGFFSVCLCVGQILILNQFGEFESVFKSKRRFIFGSALITGIAFIILSINRNILIIALLLLFIGGFGLARQTLFNSYMNKHIESHNRATVLSFISMIQQFIKGLAYPLVGIAVEISLRYSLIIIGVLIIIFAIISKVEEEHLID